MEKSEIELRLTFRNNSTETINHIDIIKGLVPDTYQYFRVMGERGMRDFKDGKGFRPFPVNTFFTYKYNFSTIALQECNDCFLSEWSQKKTIINKLRSEFNFEIELNYDIFYKEDFPIVKFDQSFISFLSELNITIYIGVENIN